MGMGGSAGGDASARARRLPLAASARAARRLRLCLQPRSGHVCPM